MAHQALILIPTENERGASTGSAMQPRMGRVRGVARAIVDWFLTSPSPERYIPRNTSQESAGSRAIRIRRNQEMVDDLFAQPGPEESAFMRYWGGHC